MDNFAPQADADAVAVHMHGMGNLFPGVRNLSLSPCIFDSYELSYCIDRLSTQSTIESPTSKTSYAHFNPPVSLDLIIYFHRVNAMPPNPQVLEEIQRNIRRIRRDTRRISWMTLRRSEYTHIYLSHNNLIIFGIELHSLIPAFSTTWPRPTPHYLILLEPTTMHSTSLRIQKPRLSIQLACINHPFQWHILLNNSTGVNAHAALNLLGVEDVPQAADARRRRFLEYIGIYLF